MNNLLADIKTSVSLFGEMRKARKDGREIQIRRSIPCISVGYGFYDTIEGCLLTHYGKDIHDIVKKFFYELSDEERCWLSSVPKNGEFIERANFWRASLKPLMTPAQYGIAVTAILQWYIHIKQTKFGENRGSIKCR